MAIDYVRDIISSGYNLSKINENFAKIQTALQDGISRSGNGPNQMEADLDMNGNNLLNVSTLTVDDLTIAGENVTGVLEAANAAIGQAQAFTDLAEGFSVEAQGYASDAAASAVEASQYADFVKNNWSVVGPFTGSGVEEDYLLTSDPGSKNNMFVIVSGVTQLVSSYELVYTLGSPYIRINVPIDVEFEVRIGNAIDVNTPSAGSVTITSLAASAKVEAQINTATDTAFDDADMLTARKTADGSLIKRSWGNVKASLSAAANARFKATKNGTNQTGITSATETKVTFGTESFDEGGYYDTTNSRWTPPAGGVCLNAVCQVAGTLSATAQLAYLVIYKNGVAFAYGPSVRGANTGNSAVAVTATDVANGTDYYEVFVGITTSSGTGTVTGTATANRFEGFSI